MTLIWMSLDLTDDNSGNGLVPSGSKPLHKPILTQTCQYMAALGHNELTPYTVEDSKVQDCGVSTALSMEILQSCVKLFNTRCKDLG